jgi:Na+/melibiose symporter-like transporter
VLTSLALLYFTHYLLVVVGLRPELAGAVQLIGRAIDAFADPGDGADLGPLPLAVGKDGARSS